MRRLNISAWAIRTPIPSVVMFIVLVILGVLSFRTLPVERFPNIDFPLVSISITQAGASPSELETQVTKRVENAVAAQTGVKHVTSTITDGSSVTMIEFQLGTNTDRALNDVKDAISRIRQDLPRTIDEPISQRIDVAGLPIITYAASSPGKTIEELSWFIDDTVARELQVVKGVAEVRRVGGVEREIRVALIPDRLLALGITAGDVSRQLRATNVDVAGGKSEIGGSEQSIRALASAQTVERLAATTITLPGGRKVRLDELGKVSDSYEEPKTFARFDGQEVVGFNISRAKGASDVVVAQLIDKKIAELHSRHPDVKLQTVNSTVIYTEGNYNSTMHTLIEGALLAVLVVFLFLRDLARHADGGHCDAAVDPADLLGDGDAWLFAQSGDALVADAGHRHSRRRCDRGDREHRPAYAHGQIALSRRAGGRRRNRPGGHRDHLHDRGGVRAGQLHGRHCRAVFPQFGITVAVGGAVLAAGRAADYADDIGLFPARPPEKQAGEGWLLRHYTRLISWSVRHRFATVGLGMVSSPARSGAHSSAARVLAGGGCVAHSDRGRIAARFAPGRHESGERPVTEILKAHPKSRASSSMAGAFSASPAVARRSARRPSPSIW